MESILLPTYYNLPTTTYLLQPTYYSLPTTVYLLLPTFYNLPTTTYLLQPTYYNLPTHLDLGHNAPPPKLIGMLGNVGSPE